MMKLTVAFCSFATALTNHVIYIYIYIYIYTHTHMYKNKVTPFSSSFIYIYIKLSNVRESLGLIFMVVRIRNISDISCKENRNTFYIQ
jgi:hypothetical protein